MNSRSPAGTGNADVFGEHALFLRDQYWGLDFVIEVWSSTLSGVGLTLECTMLAG